MPRRLLQSGRAGPSSAQLYLEGALQLSTLPLFSLYWELVTPYSLGGCVWGGAGHSLLSVLTLLSEDRLVEPRGQRLYLICP